MDSRPRTRSSASTTCQVRVMSDGLGENVGTVDPLRACGVAGHAGTRRDSRPVYGRRGRGASDVRWAAWRGWYDLVDIEDAARRIAGVIRSTPVDWSDNLSRLAGRPVVLKPEHLQRTGSYKIRGAYNHISRLPAGSGRGHRARLATTPRGSPWPPRCAGCRRSIFMPVNAAAAQGRGHPGLRRRRCVLEGDTVDDCMDLAADRGAVDRGGVRAAVRRSAGHRRAGDGRVGDLPPRCPRRRSWSCRSVEAGSSPAWPPPSPPAGPAVQVIGVEAAGAPTLRRALDAGRPVLPRRRPPWPTGPPCGPCPS